MSIIFPSSYINMAIETIKNSGERDKDSCLLENALECPVTAASMQYYKLDILAHL